MRSSSRGLVGRAGSLRLSLLVSLGVVPVACGGTAVTKNDGSAGAAQGGAAQGGAAQGGAAQGGAAQGGAAQGGAGQAGVSRDLPGGGPSYAGSVALAGAGGAIAGAGGTAGGGGMPNRVPACESPVEDPVNHLVTCANGLVHRPTAVVCTLPPQSNGGASGTAGAGGANAGAGGASAGSGGTAGTAGGAPPQCTTDADCSGKKLGYCAHSAAVLGPGGTPASASCQAGCLQDSDCSNGICLCDGSPHGGTCRYSNCKIDADCGSGFFCSHANSICGNSPSFQCLKRDDQCWTSADCRSPEGIGIGSCIADGNGALACFYGQCGRPFLVEETARLAEVNARQDWLAADLHPDVLGLTALERAELAAHWARLGQMEHASIAAFARFSLQLLSLGAPAALVEGCNRALVDETRHTRLCFALASQYGDMPIGPGPLDVQDCFGNDDLASVMKLVLSEGCIGETVAALDAMEQAATASDPVVHSVLSGIARDEQRHAELAYRFMRWALGQSSAEVRNEMAREAELRIASFERTVAGVRFIAAREVVRPLLTALFSEAAVSNRGTAPSQA